MVQSKHFTHKVYSVYTHNSKTSLWRYQLKCNVPQLALYNRHVNEYHTTYSWLVANKTILIFAIFVVGRSCSVLKSGHHFNEHSVSHQKLTKKTCFLKRNTWMCRDFYIKNLWFSNHSNFVPFKKILKETFVNSFVNKKNIWILKL